MMAGREFAVRGERDAAQAACKDAVVDQAIAADGGPYRLGQQVLIDVVAFGSPAAAIVEQQVHVGEDAADVCV